ncbi:MAG TPA: hypothetical protein VLK89_04180 [Solirubrobacterales bacterium]|nr:hypothetical protein [Solirubrobacterales bacterium]
MIFRYFCKLLVAVAALAALTALTSSVAEATTSPAPGYEQFAGCPDPGAVPTIATCFRSVTTGGVLQMGNLEIPIAKPITLSGGMTETGKFVFGSKGGLLPAKQHITGGVVGLTGFTWLVEFFGSEALTAYAVIELASNPGNQLVEPVSLPVKVHLVNSVLGSNCYIGSKTEPIDLELITGTTSPPSPNMPITGAPGETSLTPNSVTDVTGGTYVDNSFAAPGANGCVLTLFGFPPENIDGEIDAQTGLPAEAGTNTTIQDFDSESVSAALVYP